MQFFTMFRKAVVPGLCRRKSLLLFSFSNYSSKPANPFTRTWDILSKEIPTFFGVNKPPNIYPEHADVVIIGGGFVGSSVAYWLKTRAGKGLHVVVLEKDPSYQLAQNNQSFGSLIQHFSLPENIYLAKYGAEFLRKSNELLNVNIHYCPKGHLVLASEKYAEKLEQNVLVQKELGVKNELLTPEDLQRKFPWMNTNDIRLGCIGTESEGSFNSWAFLKGLINKSQELGALYVKSEVTGFELEQQRDVLMEGVAPGSFKRINRVLYTTPDGEEHAIKFAACILAAGVKSGDIAKLAKVGNGDGMLKIPLPIEQREEKVYSIEGLPKIGSLNTPHIMDTSGLWLRNEGLQNTLLCGHVPLSTVGPKVSEEDAYYEQIIKPSLLNRVPECQNVQVKKVCSEIYDCNSYDETGIIGPHPYHNNMYIATGFGKYGCQHAPGIGRAIAELIIDSYFTTIDLTRMSFDRVLTDNPLVEFNVY